MKSEWKSCQLYEVADIVDSLHKTPEYTECGIPMLRVTDIKEGYLSLRSPARVSPETYDEFTKKHRPKQGDIVVSRVGTYGVFAYVATKDKFCLGQNTAIIIPRINEKFLYYSLISAGTKEYLSRIVTGSTQKTISLKNIKAIPFSIPNDTIQERIADILSALDDKIELNKKINENLEQQAHAIYQEWFTNRAKPDWQQGHLSDLVIIRYGKDHKKLADGVFPVFGSGGLMRRVECPLYDKESVLIPRKGTLNNVMYINEPFWSVDTMFYTEMKLPNVAKFVYHFLKSKDLASMNAGSAVPSMTTDILNALELPIPSSDALATFENTVSPMYSAIQHNAHESTKLGELRDILLPKLMNGEIEIDGI